MLVASRLDAMTPLPLAPGGSLRVADGVAFVEDDEGLRVGVLVGDGGVELGRR